jgi:hypothetical protein
MTELLEIVLNIDKKVDEIKNNMMTKDLCSERRENCVLKHKGEWSNKKILAIISGIFGLFGGLVLLLVKMLK